MYTVGVFYAWDFLALILTAMSYWMCPPNIIEKKNEYVKFALLFFSAFFSVFLIVANLMENDGLTHLLFGWTVLPALFIVHMFYPFRKVRRNQHVSFFLFCGMLYVVGMNTLKIVAAMLSNM